MRGTPPCGRYGHTASVVGRRIFIFGGFDGNSQLNDVHVLDFKETEGACGSTSWPSLPSLLCGHEQGVTWAHPQVSSCVCVSDGELQYFWTQPFLTGKAPCGRYGHTASVVGTKIYVFGGNAGTNMRLNDLHILDTGMRRSI